MSQSDHLQLALAAAAMHAWSWNVASGRVDWSEGIEELVGLSPGAFGGTFEAYERVLHPEDRPVVLSAIQKALEDDRATYDIEHRVMLPSGEARWLACRGQVVRDSAGKPVRMLGVVWDATARKTAEAQIASSERRAAFLSNASKILGSSLNYAATLASVATAAVPGVADGCIIELAQEDGTPIPPVGAHIDDAKLEIALELSRRYQRMSKLAHGIPGVLRSGEPECLYEISESMLEQGARSDPELVQLHRALGVVSSMTVPMIARGRTLGAILLIREDRARLFDEQDLAMAEELGRRAGVAVDNARLYAEARDADRRKDEFLAMLGHELRNPLAPILTALELMRLRGDETFERERTIIARHVQHVVRLVDDLLDVSRITRGKIAIRKELVEVFKVISKSVEMASPMFEVRSQNLAVSVSQTGLQIMADQERLSQAISNLLINAAKFTEPNGRVWLDATGEGDEVVIRVRDSGIGIAPEILPRIFDLFVQHARSLDRSQGGLGLGLSIVKSLVSLHGGAVTAHSDGLGKGSEFVVRLPRATESILASEPGRSEPLEKGERSRLRVLIVDDNTDAAALLADALGLVGYSTHVAHDGPSALAAAPSYQPDVALLDIGLPVMDGYEVARRLRDLIAGVQLVAITGYGQESDRALSRRAGFDEHMVKPVDLNSLLAVLERMEDRPNPAARGV